MANRTFESEQEVLDLYLQDKEKNKLVIFKGVVYDVKEYMPDHPGGGELIEEHLGKNIEEPFEEAEHTKHAAKLLKALPQVGVISEESLSKSEKTKSTSDSSIKS